MKTLSILSREYLIPKRISVAVVFLSTAVSVFFLFTEYVLIRGIATSFFMLILPGFSILHIFTSKKSSFVEDIVKAFLISYGLNQLIVLVLSVTSVGINKELYIASILFVITVAVMASLIRLYVKKCEDTFRATGTELISIGILFTLFLALSIFALLIPYMPTPDEINFFFKAQVFSLDSGILFLDTGKMLWFRPSWHLNLAGYIVLSENTLVGAQIFGAIHYFMLTVTSYLLHAYVFREKSIGLVSGLIVFLSPVLFLYGINILTDLPLALFFLASYYFYFSSLRFNESRLSGISLQQFSFSIIALILGFFTKVNPTFIAVLYLQFLYLVWGSSLKHRRVLMCALLFLPLCYLALLDVPYNYFLYVLHDERAASLLRPYMPFSFVEVFLQLIIRLPWSEAVPLTALPLLTLIQKVYLIFSPYNLTYSILFLLPAGIIAAFFSKDSSVRMHLWFFVFLTSISILLTSVLFTIEADINRQSLYLYPFILGFAAYGFWVDIKHARRYLTSCLSILFFVILSELTLLDAGGIFLGYSGLWQYSVSFLTLQIVPGVVILVWKIHKRILVSLQKLPVLSKTASRKLPSIKLMMFALLILTSVIQIDLFIETGFRTTRVSSFQVATDWLQKNTFPGDTILANAPRAILCFFGNQTLLSSFKLEEYAYQSKTWGFNLSGVLYRPLPATEEEFVRMTLLNDYKFLVLFTEEQYIKSEVGHNYSQYYLLSPPIGTTEVFRYPSDTSPLCVIYAPINGLMTENGTFNIDLENAQFYTSQRIGTTGELSRYTDTHLIKWEATAPGLRDEWWGERIILHAPFPHDFNATFELDWNETCANDTMRLLVGLFSEGKTVVQVGFLDNWVSDPGILYASVNGSVYKGNYQPLQGTMQIRLQRTGDVISVYVDDSKILQVTSAQILWPALTWSTFNADNSRGLIGRITITEIRLDIK